MNPLLPVDPAYERIVCAVGVGPGPREAMHQALSVCGPDAAVHFVAARRDGARDDARPGELSEMQARGSLEIARDAARSAGVEATASLLRGGSVEELLIDATREADLLVIAASTWLGDRAEKVAPTVWRIAGSAPCPVLVARHREPLLVPYLETAAPPLPPARQAEAMPRATLAVA